MGNSSLPFVPLFPFSLTFKAFAAAETISEKLLLSLQSIFQGHKFTNLKVCPPLTHGLMY